MDLTIEIINRYQERKNEEKFFLIRVWRKFIVDIIGMWAGKSLSPEGYLPLPGDAKKVIMPTQRQVEYKLERWNIGKQEDTKGT